MWNSHVERTQKRAPEQILVIVRISPTLNVANAGTIIQFLDEKRLVYLPSLASDDC
jgi:hypothetical protein